MYLDTNLAPPRTQTPGAVLPAAPCHLMGRGAAAGTQDPPTRLARKRAERHRPPERRSDPRTNENLERSENRAKSPSASPASGRPTPFAEGAGGPPRRARGAKALQGAAPPTPESTRGNVSPPAGCEARLPPLHQTLSSRSEASPRPEGARPASALSPSKPPQPPPPPLPEQVSKSVVRHVPPPLRLRKSRPWAGRRAAAWRGGASSGSAPVGGAAAVVRQGAAEVLVPPRLVVLAGLCGAGRTARQARRGKRACCRKVWAAGRNPASRPSGGRGPVPRLPDSSALGGNFGVWHG